MGTDEVWLSIGLGVGLGLLYVVLSFVSNQRALRSKRNAMLIVVAAMMIRLMIALVLLVAILMLLPVAPTALLGSFFVMFVAGLGLEIWVFHHREVPEA